MPYTYRGCPYYKNESTTQLMPQETQCLWISATEVIIRFVISTRWQQARSVRKDSCAICLTIHKNTTRKRVSSTTLPISIITTSMGSMMTIAFCVLRRSLADVQFGKNQQKNGVNPFTCMTSSTFASKNQIQRRIVMAGKTKSMSQIKQLLLLKKQNVSNRKAATQVGMDKETVNNYVRKALADPLGIDCKKIW